MNPFVLPEELYNSLMVTPGGKVVPVSSLAELVHTTGMTQIRHLERIVLLLCR